MGLKQKFLFPIAFCVLACAGAGFWILNSELAHVKRYFLTQMAEARAAEVSQKVNILSRQALEKAALFSRLPFVVEACSKALSGKPQEELDPVGQEAREELRRVLAPYIAGFFDSTGEKLRLHITLSNGHSLLRAWQDKQTLRNNVWTDISDDLSATRPTLGVVAQTGKSLTGIELGRSGLDIRGIAPIRTPDGKQVGAVETQTDFNAVLDRDSQGAVNGFMFMSAEHLSVTTSLNDRSKYPLLEDKFVLLAGSPTNPSYRLISIEFLSKAKSGVQLALFDNKALAAFPIKDFQGKQLGVMVMPFDTSLVTSIISSMMTSLGSMLGVMLFVISSAVVVLLIYLVTRPVDKVVRLIKDLNNDNADMSERLDESSHDEIGRLCRWFNKLMGKITDMLCRVEGYRNVVDAIHHPIFAVDEDFKLILANKAALLAVGAPNVDAVLGKTCSETFNTDICGSDKCAIANGKRLQGFYETGLVEMKLKGVNRITRPFSDVVYDCNGKVAGYLEVINDVTDLVMKEREVASNLERISEVNNQLAEVSSRVATTSTQIAAQVEEVSKGSVRQRQLVSEAASSMLQMNSTIVEVAKNASYAAEQAAKGQGKAQEGAQVVTEAMQAISHVNDLSADLKTNLNELGVQANDIGKIMNVISDIADQTNLLALNAAIEAARAGEAGRGFAVVADEVRKLAEKTLNATQEVRQAIESIQNGSQKNLNSMEAVTGAVDKATSLSKRSGEALTEIVDLVQTTSTQVMSIATAAEEQSAASEHISRTIGEVNDISSQTADGMRHSSQAVNELSNLAQLLKRIASN